MNELANAYSLSGQPDRAVPLFERANDIYENVIHNKGYLAIGLGNLADDQLKIGALAAAEENLRRSIALGREIEDEGRGATGRYELGRVLAYEGRFAEAEEQFATAFAAKRDHRQAQGVIWAYRALRALLMGQAGQESEGPLAPARRARELADIYHPGYGRIECDIIRAEWVLGAAHRARGELAQAEPHVTEALRRCHRINLIEMEPNILLELARLRLAEVSGSGEEQPETLKPETVKLKMGEALSLAREALEIADRCEYRLVQADCHNFLAQVALAAGDLAEARQHAETARERAWCDGPPHRYEMAFLEAERLLGEIESLNHE